MLFLSIILPYASDEYKDVKRRTRQRPFRRVGSPNVNCMHRPTAFYRRRLAICRERGPHGFAGVNKAVAAVLTAGIVVFLTGTVGMNLGQEHPLEKPAIKIEVPEGSSPSGQPGPAPLWPVANLLAKADVGAGEAYANKVCSACHTFNQGGPAKIGPNLYNVVGGPHAHMKGFNYSNALKSKQGP